MSDEPDKLRRMVDNLVKAGTLDPATVETARKISNQQKAALAVKVKDYEIKGKR